MNRWVTFTRSEWITFRGLGGSLCRDFCTNDKCLPHPGQNYNNRWCPYRWPVSLSPHKKNLIHIKSFVGTSPNAMLTQIWTGLIAFLLLRYLQHKAAFKWALSNLVSFIRLACFTKVSLMQWLDHPFEVEKPPPKDGALALF